MRSEKERARRQAIRSQIEWMRMQGARDEEFAGALGLREDELMHGGSAAVQTPVRDESDRRGRSWSGQEEQRLLRMREEGLSASETAVRLGRGEKGVEIRLAQIDEGEKRRSVSRDRINAAWQRMNKSRTDE